MCASVARVRVCLCLFVCAICVRVCNMCLCVQYVFVWALVVVRIRMLCMYACKRAFCVFLRVHARSWMFVNKFCNNTCVFVRASRFICINVCS